MNEAPVCPVCGEPTSWDPVDERFECRGVVQHCYITEGNGPGRVLVLVASGSGEDCELFETFPWPQRGGNT